MESERPAAKQCPDCGQGVPVDPRFVTWCAACGWNVDPGAPEAPEGRLEAVRRRLARRHGEQLFAEGADGLARKDASSILARALALLVHAVTLGLAVAGTAVLVSGIGTFSGWALGLLLLGTAVVLRPRFGSLSTTVEEPVLHRADAPQLFGLIDEVAAVVGTRGVDAVVIEADANASVSTYGIRQRRVLRLGLGLWEVLTPRQRVALLGHELGHYANGDTRHSAIVHNALRSLSLWVYFLSPTPNPTMTERFANYLMAVPRWAVYGVLVLLDQLTLRAAQRAEYLADEAAARAASTDAAVELMDKLLVAGSVSLELRRESVAAQTKSRGAGSRDEAERGLWDRLAERIGAVPEREYERLRRVAALRGHAVDSTHPPTHLRRRRLAEAAAHPAAVRPTEDATAAIDAELAGSRSRVARRVIRDYAG
ncbi:M48 family metallopeptidase [Streptomyces melanogenes]|uniref:M48 family metallopeptidase n=1 Tax=Streptomyces melanogenes TaxID=67326 RepID=UPI0037AAB79F